MSSIESDEPETLLFSLVYCSRASSNLERDELDGIIAVARRNNLRRHITGWLVYSSGIFFQWLEGRREDVERLMSTISADPRHEAIVVLSETEEIRERLFSAWDMELVSAADIRAVLFDAISSSTDSKSVRALKRLSKELDARSIAGEA